MGKVAFLAVDGVYLGLYEFLVEGQPIDDPTPLNNARRLIQITWGLVLRVAVAAYTANLAAILSRVSISVPYASVQECIDGRCNFCTTGHAPTNDALNLYYPGLNVVRNASNPRFRNEKTPWANLANETHPLEPPCDATWTYRFAGYRFQTFYQQAPCDVNLIGGQLFSMPLALPVNPDYATTLNYHILKLVNEGVWERLKVKYDKVHQCEWVFNQRAFEAAASASAQLSPSNFFGPAAVVLVGLLIAMSQRACARTYTAMDADGDGIVTAEELRAARMATKARLDLDGDGKVTASEFLRSAFGVKP